MSNDFLNIHWRKMPMAFLSGLFNGKLARQVKGIKLILENDAKKTFKGLSYIFLGFVFQAVHEVSQIFFEKFTD